MVITQKVTSLAFSLHDGLSQKEEDLVGVRKYHALRFDYFSFCVFLQLQFLPLNYDFIIFSEKCHLFLNTLHTCSTFKL